MAKTKTRVLTDHEEIRRWAEERGAQPARVKGTGGDGDVGMIRLDFPGYTGEESLEPISWDEWFRKFDESNLALLVQDETARGERSNFNKLIGRETAQARAAGVRRASRRRLRTGAASGTRRRSSSRQPPAPPHWRRCSRLPGGGRCTYCITRRSQKDCDQEIDVPESHSQYAHPRRRCVIAYQRARQHSYQANPERARTRRVAPPGSLIAAARKDRCRRPSVCA